MRINDIEKTAVMADLRCNRDTPDGLQPIEELLPVQRSSRKQEAVEKKKKQERLNSRRIPRGTDPRLLHHPSPHQRAWEGLSTTHTGRRLFQLERTS